MISPGEATTLIMLSGTAYGAIHFGYLAPSGNQHLLMLFRVYRVILGRYWQHIGLFFVMASFVVYRVYRFIWIKRGRKEVGALTAYSASQFGAGNMPLEVERPDGR